MKEPLGFECKLYYGAAALTTGQTALNGSYTEFTPVKDVSVPLDKDSADMTSRASGGWKATRGGLKDGGVDFDFLWDPTNAGMLAIRNAYLNNTKFLMAIMDGDITTANNEGFVANFEILGFNFTQPLTEGVSVSVTAKPRDHQEWYKVA